MSHDEFRAFYEEHARRLWAYVAKLSGCQSAADDIVQEAFLRMMTAKLPINMSQEHRKHYLYKVATNLARRRAGARHHEDIAELTIEAPAEHHDDILLVREAMERMRRPERGLLWLAYVEKLSHRDIGDILGYRENSVRPLLHRAKDKLIRLLRGGSPAANGSLKR
jgi:RNA polymerase sigma-70 factor (ECF subfamily)